MRFANNFILLGLLNVFFCWSQYKPSINYTTTDGLPNNAVRSLYLDKNSKLWIGTENGISIFENGTFNNLKFPKNISNYSCWDITQDDEGNMWFASYGGGVYQFNGKKFSVIDHRKGLPNDRTRKLFYYKNKIFIATQMGVAIFENKTKKLLVPKGIKPHFDVFIVTDFFSYKGDVYFTAVNEGLFKIIYKNNIPSIEEVINYKHAYSLGFYNNTLYSGNKGFLDSFKIDDVISAKNISKPFGQSTVWDFVTDKHNTLYAAAWGVFDLSGGLYKIDHEKMENISNAYGIDSKNLLNVVYNTKQDILYVGSKDKGIYEIQLDQTIDYDPFENKSIIGFQTLSKQKVILHQDGLSFLDHRNKVSKMINLIDFKNFEINFIKKTKEKLPTHKDGYYELNYKIPASDIEFYEILKQDKSLFITSNIGIFEVSFLGEIKNYFPIHSYKIGFTAKNQLIETIPYGGVRIYDDPNHLKAKHFSEFTKTTPLDIVGILNQNNKTYLVSVFNGLFVYKNNQFHSLLNDKIWNESKLKFITSNSKGNIVIASEFGSVYVIDDSKSFRVLKEIPKNQIIGTTITFLEAYQDFIFIGTDKGINIFKDNVIRLFDGEQGLKNTAITTSHIFENQLWLGTKKGYYTIDLKKITEPKETVTNIEIRSISINSIPLKESNYNWFTYNSKQLICDYKHNTVSLDFIPKGHLFPSKLKFRYRLKNTNNWSPYSSKSSIYLSYLPSDSYNLEIEVFDLNAGKATVFNVLAIVINPPFWQSWWFYTLLAITIIAISVFIILRIKKQAKQKADTESLIAQSKLQVLLSQMNPHFTFNAMNAIQSFVFDKNTNAYNSSIYISEFAKLMRQTLDNSSKLTISIENEIEYLDTYFSIENQRFENRIKYKIDIDSQINIQETEIPTMLLQPFVENIFKHAFNKTIAEPKFSIYFKLQNQNLLEVTIRDNGKGSKNLSKTHISKGITIAKERIAILQPKNKNAIVVDFSENGTTVKISLFI